MDIGEIVSTFVNNPSVSSVATIVIALAGFAIKKYVASKRLQQALEILAKASVAGAEAAWTSYTAAKKAASVDGKLTDEEKAEARKLAAKAALDSVTDSGKKLLSKVFKDGLDSALEQAVEANYETHKAKLIGEVGKA